MFWEGKVGPEMRGEGVILQARRTSRTIGSAWQREQLAGQQETHSFAKEQLRLPAESDMDVMVQQRRGQLEEGERDTRGDREGGRVAQAEDVVVKLERELGQLDGRSGMHRHAEVKWDVMVRFEK